MANHLTDEQRQKAATFVNKVGKCSACGGAALSVEDIVLVNPVWDGVVHAGSDSIPMLQVICTDCFHIMHFAAVPMGLM